MHIDKAYLLRTVVVLDSNLSNSEVGELLNGQLLDNVDTQPLCLTSDQWSSLIQQRQAAGRPLHIVEVR